MHGRTPPGRRNRRPFGASAARAVHVESRPCRPLVHGPSGGGVEGGGTGDGAIMLAQQLSDAGSSGSVVYLDLSEASRRIAERRAEVRNLSNIRFHSGSLFDTATLGPFDYIDCCGVLHHLEAPEEGLSTLAGALSPHGGMGLMVYGKYGRNGVYPLQKMLRALGSGLSLHEQVEIAKKLVESLPANNWFKRNPMLVDHRNSDAGLVDLLLHSQDRAYLVEEVGALVNSAGLSIVSFVPPVQYEPSHLLQDPELLERLNGLNPMARAAFAEQLSGNLKQHAFYVVPAAQRLCQSPRWYLHFQQSTHRGWQWHFGRKYVSR